MAKTRRGGAEPGVLSRNERRSEAGFVAYCKCDKFKAHPAEITARDPHLRGRCARCGSLKPEWRCPLHGLKATPLVREGRELTAGCARCGLPPQEQFYDSYMARPLKAVRRS